MKGLLLGIALSSTLLAPAESLDVAVRHAAQAVRRPALEGPANFLSYRLGRPQVAFGVLLAIAVFGGPYGNDTARLALLALVPVNLVVEVVKRITDRARPDGEHHRSNASFPSSHAANVFVLMVVFARRWRRYAAAFLAFAVVMAASRIYLDRHWFSDVVVGAALGGLGAWWMTRAWERRQRRAPPGAVLASGAGGTADQ